MSHNRPWLWIWAKINFSDDYCHADLLVAGHWPETKKNTNSANKEKNPMTELA